MSVPGTRALRVLFAALLALAAGMPATTVTAADDPVAAVEEFLDLVSTGNLADFDRVVCNEQLDAARNRFDPATALGFAAPSRSDLPSLAYRVDDAQVDLIDANEESATVRLTATLHVEIDESQVRELLRTVSESDGAPMSDEDLDLVVPVMMEIFNQGEAVDEDISMVHEAEGWKACAGIGLDQSADATTRTDISVAGICGVLPIASVNAITPEALQFDSSYGGEDYCSFESSADGGRSATLSLTRGVLLDDFIAAFPGGTDVVVAGTPGYVAAGELFVGLPQGVLEILVTLGDQTTADFDAANYVVALGELVVPLMGNLDASGNE